MTAMDGFPEWMILLLRDSTMAGMIHLGTQFAKSVRQMTVGDHSSSRIFSELERERRKKKREKYGWAEDETSESETWRYICLPLTNPAPDKKGWKIIPHLNVDLFLNFSLPIFLNVWKEKDKCYPAGVFHISIDVLVLYHKSGVEMKEEFFIGRGWWQHLSPRYLFGYTYFSIFNDIYRLIFLLF